LNPQLRERRQNDKREQGNVDQVPDEADEGSVDLAPDHHLLGGVPYEPRHPATDYDDQDRGENLEPENRCPSLQLPNHPFHSSPPRSVSKHARKFPE